MDSVYFPEIFPSLISLDRFYSEPEQLDITLTRGAAVSLFDSITLPSLRQLHVHYSGAAGFISAIRSLVLCSSCNLHLDSYPVSPLCTFPLPSMPGGSRQIGRIV